MDNQIEISAKSNVLSVKVSGKLTRESYESFVPTVEELIAACGKVRILFEMHDFHGWTAGALWEDVKFDARHWKDIERLAIDGESKWQEGMAAFCKPFTAAKVQYFDQDRLEEAREWITADD